MPSLATKKKAKGKGKGKGSGKRGGKGKAKKVATGDGWADGDCYHQLRFTLSADFEDDTLCESHHTALHSPPVIQRHLVIGECWLRKTVLVSIHDG